MTLSRRRLHAITTTWIKLRDMWKRQIKQIAKDFIDLTTLTQGAPKFHAI